jgi:hypothetical protein
LANTKSVDHISQELGIATNAIDNAKAIIPFAEYNHGCNRPKPH